MVRLVVFVASLSLAGPLGPAVILAQAPAPSPAPAPLAGLSGKVDLGFPVRVDDGTIELRNLRFAELDSMIREKMERANDPLEANFGLTLAAADDSLRSQLEIPDGVGVVVVSVKTGSLGEQAGLKPNDVLLSLDDKGASDVAKVKETLLALGSGVIQVHLIRQGKHSRMSLVGPKHGFPPESAEYWIGVPVSPVDPTLRSHLADLPADSGLIVNDVVKASPAEAAGVKVNDVLVRMGGKPLKNADSLIEQIQGAAGKPVDLEILRVGKPVTVKVTPAKRSHPTPIRVRTTNEGIRLYRVPTPQPGAPAAEPQYFLEYLAPRTLQPFAPLNVQGHIDVGTPKGDEATARIEAQLKELTAKVDELKKLIDAMKR